MGKPTFLQYEKPLLTAMIQCPTAEMCIRKIRKSIDAGADALGIQLCRLKREYRDFETLTQIFNACEGRPIYVTSYRYGESEGLTDEECAELLLRALDCGATLCDVMGDLYERSSKYELATGKHAIERQKKLIGEIHRRGGEALMSSHTYKSITQEETLRIAKSHIERGADIIKIVNTAENRKELLMYLDTIHKIRTMTDRKLLLLLGGKGELIRYIGPSFGVCMYLCVYEHDSLDTPAQPLIQDVRAVRDSIRLKWE